MLSDDDSISAGSPALRNQANKLTRTLSFRYVFALSALAIQIFSGSLLMGWLLHRQQNSAEFVSIVGSQCMRSQNIARDSQDLLHLSSPIGRATASPNLINEANHWSEVQTKLESTKASDRYGLTASNITEATLKQIRPIQVQILHAVYLIANGRGTGTESASVLQNTHNYLNRMNSLLRSYSYSASSQIKSATRTETLLLFGLAANLLLDVVFVYFPSVNEVRRALTRLCSAHEENDNNLAALRYSNAELSQQRLVLVRQQRQLESANSSLALTAALLERARDAIVAESPDGIITHWSVGAEALFGYCAKEVIGQPSAILVPHHLADQQNTLLDYIEAGDRIDNVETVRLRKDGNLVSVSLSASSIVEPDGSRLAVVWIAHDITERRKEEDSRRIAQAQFRAAIDGSMDSFFLLEAVRNDAGAIYDYRFVELNRNAEQLLRRPREEVLTLRVSDIHTGEQADLVLANYIKVTETRVPVEDDLEVICVESGNRWFRYQVVPVGDGVAVNLRDITDQLWLENMVQQQIAEVNESRLQLMQQAEELATVNQRLHEMATRDGLTGLKNHRAFQECLQDEFQRAKRCQHAFSVVLLDVDSFKQYNDTYGHPAGDQVLKNVGAILEGSVRGSDFVARYGGEEFVVLLPYATAEGAMCQAERIRANIQDAVWPHRKITVSIGVATSDEASSNAASLVDAADRALYLSKTSGKNRVTFSERAEHEAIQAA